MLGRKIAKIILMIGMTIIIVLMGLFLYVSMKVKGELEEQINEALNLAKEESKEVKIDFKPFKCSGFFEYQCKTDSLLLMADDKMLVKIKNFIVGFKDIRIDSMKEYATGEIESFFQEQNIPENFRIQSFKYEGDDIVLQRNKGEVSKNGTLKLFAPNINLNIQSSIKLKSHHFIDKNIIKIMIENYAGYKNSQGDLLLNLKQLSLTTTSKDTQQALLDYFKQNNLAMEQKELDKIVDQSADVVKVLLGIFGMFESPYSEQIENAINGYANLFKGKIQALEICIDAKREQYFDIKKIKPYYNLDDIQRLMAKMFNSYDLKIKIRE